MTHPTFFDSLAAKIYSRYLHSRQLGQTIAQVNVGIVHKIPSAKPYWKIMDYLYLNKGSLLRFLGLAKDLKVTGDVQPNFSLFELVRPVTDDSRPTSHPAAIGDLVCLTPPDRRFIYPAPESILQTLTLAGRGSGGPLLTDSTPQA